MRRIAKLEAEQRDIARKLERAEPGSDWHARLFELADDLAEELTYWRHHLASLEAAGTFKVCAAADLGPGDTVRTRFGFRTVVSVNRKSLTVSTPYSWTDTLPYDEVRGNGPTAEPSRR